MMELPHVSSNFDLLVNKEVLEFNTRSLIDIAAMELVPSFLTNKKHNFIPLKYNGRISRRLHN